MQRDLDRLMERRNLDALLVRGAVHGNPPLHYLTNGASLMDAIVLKRRGATPLLVVRAMEREVAQSAGLPIVLDTHYDYRGLLQRYEGDVLKAEVAFLQRILAEEGVAGRVAFYGMQDQGQAYVLLRALQEATPGIEVVGEIGDDLITEARATKSVEEVERIAEVGRRTVEVVQELLIYLRRHNVSRDEILLRADGSELLVGHVHAHIHRLVALQGLEVPEGFIFATGRDAGIPHSQGTLSKAVRLGESIVFDIFPCEAGGGYFFDLTRTFCLGYAPEEVVRLHSETRDCLQMLIAEVMPGRETGDYQRRTCSFYEQRGHPTICDDPRTLEGYVHGVGHGLGLKLHEAPSFRDTPDNRYRLQPGHVFTLEPGLYYPEAGMGCRLEDVIWIDNEGEVHNLTACPYDLVIPVS
ncbi:MAG: M24 family metallopeptidase [Anaerolineales bacterium]